MQNHLESEEEFQFALELFIVSRNETGATFSNIRDDYLKFFGRKLESIFGYHWSEYLLNLLNSKNNVYTRRLPNGCILFFMKLPALKKKLMSSEARSFAWILKKMNFNVENIEPYRSQTIAVKEPAKSKTSTTKSVVNLVSTILPEFYNHTLIGDNFFMELSHIDLQRPKIKNKQTERIGLCESAQTAKTAYKIVAYSAYEFLTKNVILNIGTFDILNGRSVVNIIADIIRLWIAMKQKNLKPIFTTLAPLPQKLNGEIEEKRTKLNKFLRDNTNIFDLIDIEKCFLSNGKRCLTECFQPFPKKCVNSTHSLTLWNHVGRQRVVQLMKQEIPTIHSII